MDLNKYHDFVESKCKQGQNFEERITEAALGLAGESGECVDHVKKWQFHNHLLDVDELCKELGDVMFYATMMCNALNISLESVIQKNMDKLNKRYPDGFSAEKSINRKE